MAIEKGVTEIADSEEDPMTSSPGLVPDEAADKLCAMAGVPYQERQDALHEADGLHQAFAERDANTASCPAEGLDVDRDGASVDVDASKNNLTNTMLHDTISAQEEGTTIEVGSHGLGLHPQMHSAKPEPTTRDMSDGSNVMVVQASPTTESQFPRNVPLQITDTDAQPQNPKPSEMESVEETISRDIETDLTAGHQEQHSPPSSITPARIQQEVTGSNHPIVADAQSEALGTNGQDSSSMSVDLEVPNGSACQLPDHAARDSLGQKPADEEDQAAHRNSADQHSSKNAVLTPIASTAITTEMNTEGTATGASEDAVTGVSKASLSPATNMQDNYAGSEHREVQDFEDALHNSQMDIDTSKTAMSAKEASSTIDEEQALGEKLAEEHPAVKELALSKKSADRSFDASSPTAEPATHARSHADAQPMSSPAETSPSKTPQEITLDELKAQKVALLASLSTLPAIQVLMEENALSDAESGDANDAPTETDIMAAANKIVKEHIKLLHEYNELKDVGQGLMGLIADQRGVRIVEVQEEFGIDAKD